MGNNVYGEEVKDVRAMLGELRKYAENRGTRGEQFYQGLQTEMGQCGVMVSTTWIREQCGESGADPSYVKFQTLKRVVQARAMRQEKNTPPDFHDKIKMLDTAYIKTELGKADVAVDTADRGPIVPEFDDVERAMFDLDVERAAKKMIASPAKGLLAVAKLFNQISRRHCERGGTLSQFIEYVRFRVELSHDISISNMPLYGLRKIETEVEAKLANPGFKATLAIYGALLSISNVRTKFPWGRDDELKADIRDTRTAAREEKAEQEKKQEKKRAAAKVRRKKPLSLAQQNRAMLRKTTA